MADTQAPSPRSRHHAGDRGAQQQQSGSRPTAFEVALASSSKAFCLVLPSGVRRIVGRGEPEFTLTVHDGTLLERRPTSLDLAEAYVQRRLDIDGDPLAALSVRDAVSDSYLLLGLKLLGSLILRRPTSVNKTAIGNHYTHGDDLYLSFVDERHRFYSQCSFFQDDLNRWAND